MEALKWLGSVAAAIVVLSIVLGTAAFIGAAILVGGALVFLFMVVAALTSVIKGLLFPRR